MSNGLNLLNCHKPNHVDSLGSKIPLRFIYLLLFASLDQGKYRVC